MKILTPKGKTISKRQYLSLVQAKIARNINHVCSSGHARCAAWNNGPCSEAVKNG